MEPRRTLEVEETAFAALAALPACGMTSRNISRIGLGGP
jgi:hypothetical protein